MLTEYQTFIESLQQKEIASVSYVKRIYACYQYYFIYLLEDARDKRLSPANIRDNKYCKNVV